MAETITRPCILAEDGEKHTGDTHEDIRITAKKHGVLLSPHNTTAGFITDTGRFVSQKEAAEIAFSVGQVKEKIQNLCSYHLFHSL